MIHEADPTFRLRADQSAAHTAWIQRPRCNKVGEYIPGCLPYLFDLIIEDGAKTYIVELKRVVRLDSLSKLGSAFSSFS